MRRQLLVLITTIQISLIRTLKDTCDARSGHNCNQMSESLEPEKNNMGQYLGLNDNKSVFPQTLEEFGYKFNEDGQMRNIETGEPFKFDVKEGDRAYNQKHYEALGEVITDYIYQLLEEEVKLKKHDVPVDAKEDESKSFIFLSDDAMTNDKLIILIHGSGVVRAGQWARSVPGVSLVVFLACPCCVPCVFRIVFPVWPFCGIASVSFEAFPACPSQALSRVSLLVFPVILLSVCPDQPTLTSLVTRRKVTHIGAAKYRSKFKSEWSKLYPVKAMKSDEYYFYCVPVFLAVI
ncbi:hypothetical protein OS493_035485 [Desmophyllum pertusum]|uniref:Arb2 domain-containing protein n=1 Tax=Desmophyllum pertusum TaxID=174260 RepID=A0A9X0CN61_9CNID|nr:hypothetical protein OS493_035485 [Desmophyllum pertusum]